MTLKRAPAKARVFIYFFRIGSQTPHCSREGTDRPPGKPRYPARRRIRSRRRAATRRRCASELLYGSGHGTETLKDCPSAGRDGILCHSIGQRPVGSDGDIVVEIPAAVCRAYSEYCPGSLANHSAKPGNQTGLIRFIPKQRNLCKVLFNRENRAGPDGTCIETPDSVMIEKYEYGNRGGFQIRLFIAINFSSEIRKELLLAVERLRGQATSGNFTRPENLHLTLAFIGESNDIKTISGAIGRCRSDPFELTIGGAGHFGNLYWAGIEDNPKLKALAESLCGDLRAHGFQMEERAFKPHITLARQLTSDRPIEIDIPKTSMSVSHISLMKSERINGKLTYTEVCGCDLRES